MVVEPNIDVVRRGVPIGFVIKLGSGSGGVLSRRNLNWGLTLPVVIIGVVGIPQMVFTNLITVTHGNKIADWPLMSSMVIGKSKSADVMHSRGRYQKPIL